MFHAFRRRYPRVDVQVTVADSDSLVAALEAGAIELAIVTLPLGGEGLEVVAFYRDRKVPVASPRPRLIVNPWPRESRRSAYRRGNSWLRG